MPPATDIAIIFLLILVNGFFSMAEFALISARKVRLQRKAAGGDGGAAIALELVENPTPFLSIIQIGITVVGILMGAFGGRRSQSLLPMHSPMSPCSPPTAARSLLQSSLPPSPT